MYTPIDILIQSMDIKRGGCPDSNLNFYDQMVRVEKGWVEHEFVLFIICCIATWNKVATRVTILQDICEYMKMDVCETERKISTNLTMAPWTFPKRNNPERKNPESWKW